MCRLLCHAIFEIVGEALRKLEWEDSQGCEIVQEQKPLPVPQIPEISLGPRDPHVQFRIAYLLWWELKEWCCVLTQVLGTWTMLAAFERSWHGLEAGWISSRCGF